MRSKLKKTLTDHFESELQRGVSDIKSNLSPYTHFVQKEASQLDGAEEKLKQAMETIKQLTKAVDSAFVK